ncbi:hypothetical protein BC629DRAFT_210481 [Irpex lacteus]|nr:hypothetical protein BC629DRAFT_210481 [Irpex lacteus]
MQSLCHDDFSEFGVPGPQCGEMNTAEKLPLQARARHGHANGSTASTPRLRHIPTENTLQADLESSGSELHYFQNAFIFMYNKKGRAIGIQKTTA